MHRERWNQNIPDPKFKVGNAVKSHFRVKSKSDTGEVAKLANRSQVTFQIKNLLVKNSYEVYHCIDKTYGIHKYKRSDLYLTPTIIFPHEPIETIDTKLLC